MQRSSERFPKAKRLLTRREFLAVQGAGKKLRSRHFLALWVRRTDDRTRIGLTVSSKVGNAVVRARLRRHLREWIRRQPLPAGFDVVVVAQASAAALTSREIGDDLSVLRGACSC